MTNLKNQFENAADVPNFPTAVPPGASPVDETPPISIINIVPFNTGGVEGVVPPSPSPENIS